MAHTLPQRPSFLPQPPEPVLTPSLVDLAESSAGPSAPGACTICSSPSKYTCPGCGRKTCSLPCSKAHKSRFLCTGTRDASAYIPLRKVTEGTWSDDYRYLEESRRKIAEWGGKLPPGALVQEGTNRGTKRKRPGGGSTGALKGLEAELRRRGIGVEFMAEGMERRKKNQSAWNVKTQTLYLSVQLVLSPAVAGNTDGKTINQPRLSFSSSGQLHTIQSILPKETDPSALVVALPYHQLQSDEPPYPIGGPASRFFPPLDPGISIIDALKGTRFVEFPVIRVYSLEEWGKKVRSGEVVVMPLSMGSGAAQYVLPISKGPSHPQPSQTSAVSAANIPTKTSTGFALSNPLGLGLGDYGSDEDEGDEEAES